MPVYICRLVTQSVCTRAELPKGESGWDGGWLSLQREIDSLGWGVLGKCARGCKRHPRCLSLVVPFLSGSPQGRRLPRVPSKANRVAAWAFCPHLAVCNKCIVPCAKVHKDKETSGHRNRRTVEYSRSSRSFSLYFVLLSCHGVPNMTEVQINAPLCRRYTSVVPLFLKELLQFFHVW